MYAVYHKHNEIAYDLIDKGADIKVIDGDLNNLLVFAVASENFEMVKYLVEKGAKIKADIGRFNFTPMSEAGWSGNLEIMKYLVKNGGDINEENISYVSGTPLIRASASGNIEVMQYLIDKGAKVDARDKREKSALMWAAECGQLWRVLVMKKL